MIIAEMSGNHNQSLARALEIVGAAARAGADAIKIQTFTPSSMTFDLPEDDRFRVTDPNSLWFGKSLYELYAEAATPYEWHKPIFEEAKRLGIEAFSSPFDCDAVDFLESIDCPRYKIASFELVDIRLIRKAAATKKPLIMSTGMATLAEIDRAVSEAKLAGATDITLLKCTSTYPASPENTNILTIPHMRQAFGCAVGISDHTMGIGVCVGAAALGATVFEKHFTLSRAEGGVDSAFSMEPNEFSQLVEEIGRVGKALGQVTYGPTEAEKKAVQRRRGLYFNRDMKKGEVIKESDLRAIRPANGALGTEWVDVIVGMTINNDVRLAQAITVETLKIL